MAKAMKPKGESSPPGDDDDPTLFESLSAGPELTKFVKKATDFLDKVRAGYNDDSLFAKILKEEERYATFSVRDGLVYTTNRGTQEVLCIPRKVTKDYSLTAIIIDQAHTILGHFGAQKTADYIRRWYWWPKMGNEIAKFCDSCGICQVNKTSTKRPVGLLHPLPIPNRPWGSIGMDFMGPFPESEGYDYLWVVICQLTSQVHLVPVKTTIKASELAWTYVKEVVRLHGLPDSIVSDRDSKFTSKFWRETHRLLGTKLLMSTAFHLQTDGQTEWVNQEIEVYLHAYVDHLQDDWAEWLSTAEFALNNREHSATGQTPFFLEYGRHPWNGGIRPPTEVNPAADEWLAKLTESRRAAKEAMEKAAVAMKRSYDVGKRPSREYSKGDLVWLDTWNLKMDRPSKKLDNKQTGPFAIKEKVGPAGYRLKLPRAW